MEIGAILLSIEKRLLSAFLLDENMMIKLKTTSPRMNQMVDESRVKGLTFQ